MDPLASLLDGPRAQEAFVLKSVLTAPWSLRIEDEAPLTVAAVVRGEAWVLPDGQEPVHLRPGDVVIQRGPDPYTVADDPETPPTVVIHPGQLCTTVDGEPTEMDLGVRTWGNDPAGHTVLLTGTYHVAGEIGQRLLRALPTLALIPADSWDTTLVRLLAEEITKDEPGQEAVLDRLLDLLLIAALRVWFSRPEAQAPTWYRAQSDPVVGRALSLIHTDPARQWTVAGLAARAGTSRASLAKRFTELVGEPPMSYLTNWRLALAADLLREPHVTLGAAARQVGYGSSFALSAAFKRVHGVSPSKYRRAG